MPPEPMPPITSAQLDAVLRFLPVFETPDYSYGEWFKPKNPHEWPHYTQSAEVREFVRILSQEGIVSPFNWVNWQDEAVRLYEDPHTLETADLDTLRRLLTLHIRKDRYSEGHLAAMLKEGHIIAILRRMAALRQGMEPPRDEAEADA